MLKNIIKKGAQTFHLPIKEEKERNLVWDDIDPTGTVRSAPSVQEWMRNPLVSFSDLNDYMVLLQAFHELHSATDAHKDHLRAAYDYEYWVLGALPLYKPPSHVKSNCSASPPSSLFSPGSEIDLDSMKESSYPASSVPTHLTFSSLANATTSRTCDDSTVPSLLASSGSSVLSSSSPATPSTHGSWNESILARLLHSPASSLGSYDDVNPGIPSARLHQTADPSTQTKSPLVDLTLEADSLPFPLPPLPVLMAWHAHLMRPDIFDRDTGGAYKALRGVLFPLRQAAQAIMNGTLPHSLDQVYDTAIELASQYVDSDVLDIVALIHSQAAFSSRLFLKGLLTEGYLGRRPAWGQAAIVRYGAWLEMMGTADDNRLLVPTLDVELVWKLHRLDNVKYQKDTSTFMCLDYFRGWTAQRGPWGGRPKKSSPTRHLCAKVYFVAGVLVAIGRHRLSRSVSRSLSSGSTATRDSK